MEIPRALRETVIWIEELPGIARVVATVDAAFFRFDDGVNAIAVRAGNRNANAAQDARGQSMAFESLPGRAVVAGLIKAAARPAAHRGPRIALRFVERGVQNVGIGGIKCQINRAGLVVLEQNLLPGLSAVRGTKHAASLVRPVGMAHRGDKHHVWIRRMNDNSGNVPRILQTDVGPGLPAVRSEEHTSE